MSKTALFDLNIDFEFGNLSPEMPQEQYDILEEDLVEHGCREPLLIWNDYIIDGHHRYNLCHKWEIPFPVLKAQFPSREDTVVWICQQHLKKTYLAEIHRRYLIGKYFNARKTIISREHRGVKPNGRPLNARQLAAVEIGDHFDFSYHTVYKYGVMASAIDRIFTKEPELAHRILSGQVKISFENILAVSKLSKEKLRSLNRYLSDSQQDHILYSDILHELQTKSSGIQRSDTTERKHYTLPCRSETNASAGIKEMPPYDPDAEIASLALTIPSWISTIKRVQSIANLPLISSDARQRIKTQLYQLSDTATSFLNVVKENE